jgi:uncharacterized protein YtpQ (UPF0354 family)
VDTIDRDKLPGLYNEVFNKNAAGIAILDHLWAQFYDKPAKQPLDALDLAYREGQRSVIFFIQLQRDRLERELKQGNEES